MKRRHSILILGLAGIAAAAAYFGFSGTKPAPEVTYTSIRGEKLTTSGLRGQVVLVSFWATDCAICVREMPGLARLYEKHRASGFELIAVAMRHDPPNYVLNYVQQNGVPFPVALDSRGELAQAFDNVRLTPTAVLIDKKGVIVKRILGEPDLLKLDALIAGKLAEPA